MIRDGAWVGSRGWMLARVKRLVPDPHDYGSFLIANLRVRQRRCSARAHGGTLSTFSKGLKVPSMAGVASVSKPLLFIARR